MEDIKTGIESLSTSSKSPDDKKYDGEILQEGDFSRVQSLPIEVQVPRKSFGPISMLGLAVSLMATWEALGGALVGGLISGGPVSLIYGFLVAWTGSLVTAISLGEAASMFPTAGGQYHFAAELAPARFKIYISWFSGWITVLGWHAIAATAPFVAGTLTQSLLAYNVPSYAAKRWQGSLMYWAVLTISALTNVFASKLLPLIEQLILVLHIVAFFLVFIVMLVITPSMNSSSFVWGTFQNNSGWSSDGVAWCLGLLTSAYCLVGYDGATHMSEEIENPRVNVPRAMVGSLLLNGTMGFALLIAFLYVMGPLQAILQTQTGFPVIQIFDFVSKGNHPITNALVSPFIFLAAFASIALTASASRTLWALARDKATPFASTLGRLDSKRGVPVVAVVCSSCFLALIGILNIASTTAFNAAIALAVVGLHISYLVPVVLMIYRKIYTPEQLTYGPWKLGKFGLPLNIISALYLTFTCAFMLLPTVRPVTALNMNYACVPLVATMLFSLAYWYFRGQKTYTGPLIEVTGIHAPDADA